MVRRDTIKSRRLLLLIPFIILFLIFFVVQVLNSKDTDETEPSVEKNIMIDFKPQTLSSGNKAQYDIKLKMDTDGSFQVDSAIKIKNSSEDVWGELVFYFIPNIFTKDTSEQLHNPLDVPATVLVKSITVEDRPVKYSLDKDTLTIPLEATVQPRNSVKVKFSYQFTLPEEGLRFTKSNQNYHLSQFYPMVATFRDNKWNKEEYRFRGETYHTGFNDFTVSYDIPDGYTFVSTSDGEDYPSQKIDSFEMDNVKEIFIAILKEPLVFEKQKGNVNIRVFGFEEKKDLYDEIIELASDSLHYFQEVIGPYPFAQLDILVDGSGMEYPGIVTVGSIYGNPVNDNGIKGMVVHEIAHQWFYGVINSDPYNDAWLDEGFATFAAELFHYSQSSEEVSYENKYEILGYIEDLPVNLPIDEYTNSSHIYGKASTMLWFLFENRGGIKEAEKYLKTYYDLYKYKEVNTDEFVRFTQYYFAMDDISEFEGWLEIE